MLVRKILETTLAAGSTSVTFTDSDIPNSLLRLYSTDPDLLPASQTITGSTLTVTYEVQNASKGVALEIVKQGLEIVDNVTSTDADKALSAKQGKVLKDAIDGITVTESLEGLTDVNITSPVTDDILLYDGTEEKWCNTPMPNIPASIDDLDDIEITSIQNGQVLAWNSVESKFVNVNQTGGGVDYSTNEVSLGVKWVDGKDIYRKVVDFGAFPNSSVKTVDHGITSIDTLIRFELYGKNSDSSAFLPALMPSISTGDLPYSVTGYVTGTYVRVQTGSNRTSFSGYAVLEYTKITS